MGAMLSDDQVTSLLESQRETAEELEGFGSKFDTLMNLSGEIERRQITAAKERAADAEKLAELAEKQRVDDDERTQREGARKTLALTAKILGPILGVILLPTFGWGAKWLVSDYGHTRTAIVDHSHEILGMKNRATRDRRASEHTATQVQENRDSIRTVEGRLEGIETGQGTILQAIENSRPRRR